MSTEIVPHTSGGMQLFRTSTDAAGLCKEIVVATAKNIQGKKFVPVEGWQAIAVAHGCFASAGQVERTDTGFRAIGRVIHAESGREVSTAEGFVGDDENMWLHRPEYARRAMAQTRAISRACRSAFAHVVVMMNAGLSTTPAEEMEFEPAKPKEAKPVPTPAAPTAAEAKNLNPTALKRALAEFAEHGIDEQKIRACLGVDKPWNTAQLNAAWDALIEKHEAQESAGI